MRKRDIRHKYCRYVEDNKRPPAKLKKFLEYCGISKSEFKKKYDNLLDVEADIWRSSFKDILKTLRNSTEFGIYTSREKGLAMMYAWFEFMTDNSSFFKPCLKNRPWNVVNFDLVKDLKKESCKFIKKIIKQGCSCSEFKNREFLNDHMFKIFWPIFMQNLKWWAQKGRKQKDEEWMDALIEKSMTFFFDTLAPNMFDSLFDFLKHMKPK